MSKETKTLLFVIITLVINVLAPILMIDMYKDYTAKSFIIGTPDKVVKIENLDVKDYVFQENLSTMNFVSNGNENEYIFNYYFEAKDFDSTTSNYLIYINDYMLSITDLEAKAISGHHTRYFRDANQEICNEVDIEVTFEFYSTYSYLLVKLTTPDITYFNGFRENPGLVLTLSKVDYGMIGNLEDYNELVTLQQQLDELQHMYDTLQAEHTTLQSQYNQTAGNNEELNTQISVLNAQIQDLNNQIIELQALLDGYNRADGYEVSFVSNGTTQKVVVVDKSSAKLTSGQVPVLEHTDSKHFAGWSLDGETVIDPSTVTLTANTDFIAVWRSMVGTWRVTSSGGNDYTGEEWIVSIDDNGLVSTRRVTTIFDDDEYFSIEKYNDYAFIAHYPNNSEADFYVYSAELDAILIDYTGVLDYDLEEGTYIVPNRTDISISYVARRTTYVEDNNADVNASGIDSELLTSEIKEAFALATTTYYVPNNVLTAEFKPNNTLEIIYDASESRKIDTDEIRKTDADYRVHLIISYTLESRDINAILADENSTSKARIFQPYIDVDNDVVLTYCEFSSGYSTIELLKGKYTGDDNYQYMYTYLMRVYSDGYCYEYSIIFTSGSQLTDETEITSITSILQTGAYESNIVTILQNSVRKYALAGTTYVLN